LGAPGAHLVQNSGAVVAALEVVLAGRSAAVGRAIAALEAATAPEGRGQRCIVDTGAGASVLLVDESYNANPASMRAALTTLATVSRTRFPRRIAVLGDMLELGPQSIALHAGLIDAVHAADVDLLFACGPNMRHLFELVDPRRQGQWSQHAAELTEALVTSIMPGDVVMIKGSLGSRMAPLVQAIKEKVPGGTPHC
jgi:UDP-N-acetylmuramoyl-tripeptide--D-alanyl-D-alanine ligase